MLGNLFVEAGLPEGVLSVVPAEREVSEYLVTHPGIDKVSFTGSTAAGRRVGALATERLKRVSLELGGKSAAIVLDDVDLAASAFMIAYSGLMNSGQACVAQTRILAPRSRYDEITEAVVESAKMMTVGDPPTRRPSSGRWSPSGSGTGSRATSPRARPKVRASCSTASVRPVSTTAGTSRRRSSPTSTTR